MISRQQDVKTRYYVIPPIIRCKRVMLILSPHSYEDAGALGLVGVVRRLDEQEVSVLVVQHKVGQVPGRNRHLDSLDVAVKLELVQHLPCGLHVVG